MSKMGMRLGKLKRTFFFTRVGRLFVVRKTHLFKVYFTLINFTGFLYHFPWDSL